MRNPGDDVGVVARSYREKTFHVARGEDSDEADIPSRMLKTSPISGATSASYSLQMRG